VNRRAALRSVAAFLALGGCPALAQDAAAGDATAQIHRFYDALQDAMKRAAKLGVRGRYDLLAPVIDATFDLPAMTRIAVGPKWTSIPPAEQKDLVDAFRRMTIANYASRFDGYSGERFEVDPKVEPRASGRVVRTKIVPASGDPVTLDYLMRASGAAWKIVDVYLTGTISELATRRAEFASILDAGGAPALVTALRGQADRLLQSAKS
jgi:phospholipid transport system substrate-binding protein